MTRIIGSRSNITSRGTPTPNSATVFARNATRQSSSRSSSDWASSRRNNETRACRVGGCVLREHGRDPGPLLRITYHASRITPHPSHHFQQRLRHDRRRGRHPDPRLLERGDLGGGG